MHHEFDQVVPCVGCDNQVLTNSQRWADCEQPAAVCGECIQMPFHLLYLIYRLRCQLMGFYRRQLEFEQKMERELKKILTGMEDIEAALQTEELPRGH